MYCLPGKAWALGLSYGTSSRVTYAPLYGVFQTLLSDNSGPFQHRDAEASEILFSGFSMSLVVIPPDFFPDTLDFLTVLHAPLMASSRRCTDHKVQTLGSWVIPPGVLRVRCGHYICVTYRHKKRSQPQ